MLDLFTNLSTITTPHTPKNILILIFVNFLKKKKRNGDRTTKKI